MKRKSPDFWLGVCSLVFLMCLVATVFVHRKYQVAELSYQSHLTYVHFAPHLDTSAAVAVYGRTAERWLRIQAVLCGVLLLATVAIVVQVVRRRNARVAVESEAEPNA